MLKKIVCFFSGLILISNISIGQKDYPIKPVLFTQVKVSDNFWAPRLKINKEITIPIAFQKAEETGRIDNFRIAGKLKTGKFRTLYPFDDSDIFKNMEAASYALQINPDAKLEAYLDTLITFINAAQEKDGYIYTNRTIDPLHTHEWAGSKRWEYEEILSHELYNAGHMYEAAVAHFLATGKRNFLDIAIKNADLIDKDFGWGKIEKAPGHQVIEMGLVKLYRVTGNQKYLDLAKFFVDVRGRNTKLGDYAQNHKRFIDQDSAVGHAVRAEYLYSGAADVAAMTGLENYVHALDKIWEDVVYRKMYITGGTGATGGNEGFGLPYELPNLTAYCETCASIANVFWNYRMFLLKGESKYFDVLEKVLYNATLSGISLSGDRFFYPNPLATTGHYSRSAWFGCACCPCNVTRLLPSVLGYVYATRENSLYVNLFMQSTSKVNINNNQIEIKQITDYPWSGKIEIQVNPEKDQQMELLIRVPGWATGQAIPGDLYRYKDKKNDPVKLMVNGKEETLVYKNGYAVISRVWKKGDKISLELPMTVHKVVANEKIIADKDKIAIQRGPIVYCAEWPDNPNKRALNIVIDDNTDLKSEYSEKLLNGVVVVKGKAKGASKTLDGKIITKDQEFTAIPYFAWANRGEGEMAVWFATKNEASQPLQAPTLAYQSKLTASYITKALGAINDQYEPANSNDHNISYYHWWPKKDTTHWIQYDFPKESEISSSRVYWFDDGPDGGCRIPESWNLLYKSGDKWVPVKNSTNFEVTKNKYNEIKFEKVKTKALRMEIKLQKNWSAGIYEWVVE